MYQYLSYEYLHSLFLSCTIFTLTPRWLRDLFEEADRNGDGTLDLKEVVAMLRRLNVGVSKKVIKRKFEVGLDQSCDQSCDSGLFEVEREGEIESGVNVHMLKGKKNCLCLETPCGGHVVAFVVHTHTDVWASLICTLLFSHTFMYSSLMNCSVIELC